MFIAALFRRAKQQNQPKYPSIGRGITKQNVVYSPMKYYSAIKRNEVLIHAQHGWTLKTLCQVKESRHKRPHIV